MNLNFSVIEICSRCGYFEQNQRRIGVAQELLIGVNDYLDLLIKVRAADGTYVYGYYVKIRNQSLQWKNPDEPNVKKVLLSVTTMAGFLPVGRTVHSPTNFFKVHIWLPVTLSSATKANSIQIVFALFSLLHTYVRIGEISLRVPVSYQPVKVDILLFP